MNMIRFGAIACAVAAICCSTSDLMAQRGGGMMMRMMGGVRLDSSLLAIEEVQKELELTDEQMDTVAAKAEALVEDMRGEMRDIMMGGGGMSEIKDFMEELHEDEQEFVGLLNDEQKQRLTELHYQRMGNAMFADLEVQKDLDLSDQQIQSIDDAFTAYEEIITEARNSGDFSTMREIMRDAEKEAEDTIMSVLSDEQKDNAEKMKGEPFEFPQRQRRQQRSDF